MIEWLVSLSPWSTVALGLLFVGLLVWLEPPPRFKRLRRVARALFHRG